MRAFESTPSNENGPRSYAQALDRPVARFDDADPCLCSIGNQPGAYHCIRDSLGQVAALEQQFARLQPLLLRYRELDGYPRYVDVRPAAPDLPAPDVTILRVGQLYLSALALATTGSSVEDVVAHLTRSVAIWRRALASPEVGVVEKMMASRALLAHLMFASELIRNLQPTQTAALQALDAFLAPLGETERSLRGPPPAGADLERAGRSVQHRGAQRPARHLGVVVSHPHEAQRHHQPQLRRPGTPAGA